MPNSRATKQSSCKALASHRQKPTCSCPKRASVGYLPEPPIAPTSQWSCKYLAVACLGILAVGNLISARFGRTNDSDEAGPQSMRGAWASFLPTYLGNFCKITLPSLFIFSLSASFSSCIILSFPQDTSPSRQNGVRHGDNRPSIF